MIVVVLVAAVATSCGASKGAFGHPTVPGARPVLTTAASEEGPAADGGTLAWMQSPGVNTVPPRSRTNVLARSGGRTIRVNPPNTYAQTGGIDDHALVLSISGGGRSRLARYGLATRKLAYLPRYVNDGAWLWRPDFDGHRVLYGAIVPGRTAAVRYEIRLADLDRHTVRVLARLDGHNEYAAPGQLRGDWATWVACPESACNVWRENLATGRAEDAPDPDSLVYTQIGPAVDRRGVVYFDRTLASCGNAEIRRWDGRRDTSVLRLPAKFAFQYAYLAEDTATLYFDLGGCTRTATDDVYALDLGRAP
jgi:hypothetical protein